MTLTDALSKIHAPKGLTSILAGVLGGDADSLHSTLGSPAPADASGFDKAMLEEAEKHLASAQEGQRKCQSDAAWWGYNGDIAYWKSVVNILKAVQLVGRDGLPDVEAPELANCVVMDAQSKVESFGAEILKRAQNMVENPAPVTAPAEIPDAPVLAAVRQLLRVQRKATMAQIAKTAGVPFARVIAVMDANRTLWDCDKQGRVISMGALRKWVEAKRQALKDEGHEGWPVNLMDRWKEWTFAEHAMVVLTGPVDAGHQGIVPAGTVGTVVAVYGKGKARGESYAVEIPGEVVTVESRLLEPAPVVPKE